VGVGEIHPEMSLADHFAAFAGSSARDGAMTYAAICRFVAADPELLAMMDEAPASQQRPNLMLAAVHYLLLGGAAHPLATYYDTVAAYTGTEWVSPSVAELEAVGPDFRDFCLTHAASLLDLIATCSTQTNEIGRCTALLPALSHIASTYEGGQAIGLLDLGTSAGLNLFFDRYAYTYRERLDGAITGAQAEAGDHASAVQLDCVYRGELADLPSLELPAIAERAGLDLSPIDPHDEAGVRWLLACLWPDHLPRFARLRAALDIARTEAHPPVLHIGDMVDHVGDVAATVAPGLPLVIFHSWVAAYLTEQRQRELSDTVRGLSDSSGRAVHYLYAESPEQTPGLPTPVSPHPDAHSNMATVLVHVSPDAAPIRLADMHHHGRSLRWWGAQPV